MAKENPILPKVWITKYALTSGVSVVENVEHCVGISDRMIAYKSGGYRTCSHKPDWHLTEGEANAQVRKMIAARRVSIQKSLKKLDKLEESYK